MSNNQTGTLPDVHTPDLTITLLHVIFNPVAGTKIPTLISSESSPQPLLITPNLCPYVLFFFFFSLDACQRIAANTVSSKFTWRNGPRAPTPPTRSLLLGHERYFFNVGVAMHNNFMGFNNSVFLDQSFCTLNHLVIVDLIVIGVLPLIGAGRPSRDLLTRDVTSKGHSIQEAT
ncbi:hypothetical protein EZI54_23760 [Marinobacter halodurans]|uniref:Uncharacterized protein n=1 Tax=Marinobacter halodurans TaxID=2528979 RepID=A0ABY1ZFV3_9GAMM|nr:hypothetical protein [Marinobacter halodurans]TBW44500.1 hypothetical protein EZI54_23760 [Marinobacter halodurans]